MIVLKDKSLKSVWDEYDGLKELCPENRRFDESQGQTAAFQMVNGHRCEYGDGKVQVVHLVVCRESWTQIAEKTNEPVEKNSKHAWISSMPLDAYNLHARCNLAARRRWNMENQIQDEKCNGYNYSHCYACNWNAMKGFHFLMNIAVAINELARNSEALCKEFIEKGFRGFHRVCSGNFERSMARQGSDGSEAAEKIPAEIGITQNRNESDAVR